MRAFRRLSVVVFSLLASASFMLAGAPSIEVRAEGDGLASAAERADRYIVVLRDETPSARGVADEHAQRHGATVSHVYDSALKGYAAHIRGDRLAALQADPRVLTVIREGEFRIPQPRPSLVAQVQSLAVTSASAPSLVVQPALPGAPPVNDNFASATNIRSLPRRLRAQTVAATMEPNEPIPACWGGTTFGRSTWYDVRLPTTTTVTVDTMGSTPFWISTMIAVYTGPRVDALTQVPGACADPSLPHSIRDTSNNTVPTQRLTFTAQANTTYHVQVGPIVNPKYLYPANLLVTFVAGSEPAQVAATALSRMGGTDALAQPVLKNKGAGVGVAVLDTGIDFSHPDLQPVMNGINCFNPGNLATDDNGHGSHVAGIIAARDNNRGTVGVAPGATLYAIKVADSTGIAPDSDMLCGLDWLAANAASKNIKVANVSIGQPGASDGNCGLTNGDVFHAAFCRVRDAGVTVVVSAGNGTNTGPVDASTQVPAAYDDAVITVGALFDVDGLPGGLGPDLGGFPILQDDVMEFYSNFGKSVTILAPDFVRSEWRGGYAYEQGSSMASPEVAGAVTLLRKRKPSATLADVKACLLSTQEPGPIVGNPEPSQGVVQIRIPGDVNGDGVVDSQDYNLVVSKFGTNDPNADVNHDGVVDIYDYNIVVSNFGKAWCP